MKIIYISSRKPYPKIAGREIMISQSLEFLSKNSVLSLIFFKHVKEDFSPDDYLNLKLNRLEFFCYNGFINIFINFFLRGLSFQESLYFTPQNKAYINEVINQEQPDFVFCDMIRTARLLENYEGKLIIDFDDLLSDRYKKMLDKSEGLRVLGTFENRIPSVFRFFIPFVYRFILKFEKYRIEKAEKYFYNKASKVIFTSGKEAFKINQLLKEDKAIGVPPAFNLNPIDIPFSSANFIFVGNLKTSQNLTSVETIILKIMPIILVKYPNAKLHIVGNYLSNDINHLVNFDFAVFHGFVDDITTVAKHCSIALCPISFGTGIKTKIIELMAMGFPLITNSVGAEGILAVNNDDFIVRESSDDIASSVFSLLEDYQLFAKIRSNAMTYVDTNHSYKVVSNKFLNIIGV